MASVVKINPSENQLVKLRSAVRHGKKGDHVVIPVKLSAGDIGKGAITISIRDEEADKVEKARANKTGAVIHFDSSIQTMLSVNSIAATLHKGKGKGMLPLGKGMLPLGKGMLPYGQGKGMLPVGRGMLPVGKGMLPFKGKGKGKGMLPYGKGKGMFPLSNSMHPLGRGKMLKAHPPLRYASNGSIVKGSGMFTNFAKKAGKEVAKRVQLNVDKNSSPNDIIRMLKENNIISLKK